jgi:hypothetical protein
VCNECHNNSVKQLDDSDRVLKCPFCNEPVGTYSLCKIVT